MSTTALYSGELHYWRHEADEWEALLSELAAMGCTAVRTCVPWSVHEKREAVYEFSGHRDLRAFVDLARAKGLAVRLALGPAVGAELTGFGIPERVLANKQCQALSGRGTPLWLPWPTKMFPAPSFASRAFQQQVQPWFAALGEHLAGADVIVEVECDRRALGRVSAFDGDYHPDAIEWWLDFGEGRPAPRVYKDDDMPRALTWVRFGDEYESRSRHWLTELAEEAGMVVASDALPNLTLGGAPWFPVVPDETQKNSVLAALASGTREFNLYMAAGRERWSGGALDLEWVEPLLRVLHEVEFHTLRRDEPIVVITSRAEERAAIASCALDGATSVVTDVIGLGPSGHAELSLDEAGRLYPRWLAAVCEALDLVEISYQLLGEDQLHRIDTATRAVVMPTLRRVDGGVWGALHALDMTGMRVVLGPRVPTEDEMGRPLGPDAAAPPGAGLLAEESLDDVEGLAADLLGLAGELGNVWIAPEFPLVTCTPFFDADGGARLLFARNRGDEKTPAEVNVPVGCRLIDVLADATLAETAGVAHVTLGPRETRLFKIEGGE